MKKASLRFFAYFLTLSTVFNPFLLAQESAYVANAKVIELAQNGKLQAALAQDATAANLRFLDEKGDEVGLDTIVRTNAKNYTVLSQSDERGNQVAINIRVQKWTEAEVKLSFHLHNYAVNKSLSPKDAIDSASVNLISTSDAEKTKLAFERMIKRFENAFQRTQASAYSTKNRAINTLLNFVVPSAHAGAGKTVAQVIRTISYVGFAAAAICGWGAHVFWNSKNSGHTAGLGDGFAGLGCGFVAVVLVGGSVLAFVTSLVVGALSED